MHTWIATLVCIIIMSANVQGDEIDNYIHAYLICSDFSNDQCNCFEKYMVNNIDKLGPVYAEFILNLCADVNCSSCNGINNKIEDMKRNANHTTVILGFSALGVVIITAIIATIVLKFRASNTNDKTNV